MAFVEDRDVGSPIGRRDLARRSRRNLTTAPTDQGRSSARCARCPRRSGRRPGSGSRCPLPGPTACPASRPAGDPHPRPLAQSCRTVPSPPDTAGGPRSPGSAPCPFNSAHVLLLGPIAWARFMPTSLVRIFSPRACGSGPRASRTRGRRGPDGARRCRRPRSTRAKGQRAAPARQKVEQFVRIGSGRMGPPGASPPGRDSGAARPAAAPRPRPRTVGRSGRAQDGPQDLDRLEPVPRHRPTGKSRSEKPAIELEDRLR